MRHAHPANPCNGCGHPRAGHPREGCQITGCSCRRFADYERAPGAEIAQLLRVAAICIEQGEEDRAAWRVADAGVMLRELLAEAAPDAMGMARETGRGALLPASRFAAVRS